MDTTIKVGDKVIAHVLEANLLVGEATRVYVEDGIEMVEITYDVEVFDGESVLDVEAEDVHLAE